MSAMPAAYTAVAEKITDVSAAVKRFRLRLEGGPPVVFKGGQFLMADLTKPDGTPHKRAYSIASPPYEGNPLELVIKYEEKGVASEFFFKELKEGGSFPARVPFGAFVIKDPAPDHVVFVATGTGIAPLRSMIHEMYHAGEGQKRKLWLFLGVRYDNEILYDDEWKALVAKYPGAFTYVPTVSRPKEWQGEVGYVQDKVTKFLPPDVAKACKAYACGGDAMMKALGEALVGLGAEKGQLHYEIW